MAKDQVTRKSWSEDNTFLSHVTELEGITIKPDSFVHMESKSPRNYCFKEAELYYRSPRDGFAFFHRAVKVKGNYHHYISTN
jgi:hypothetical protein